MLVRLQVSNVKAPYEREMEPADFALLFARVSRNLGAESKVLNIREPRVHVSFFRSVFSIIDADFDIIRERGFSYEPTFVRAEKVCDGKLVQVSIGLNSADDHFFFRIHGVELQYLPIAPDCWVRHTNEGMTACGGGLGTLSHHILWPWNALFPDRFRGLSEFANILDPGDENPLTGLIASKDAPARTLAKQVATKLRVAYDSWARDIVATL